MVVIHFELQPQFFFLDTDDDEEEGGGGQRGAQTSGLSTGMTMLMRAMQRETVEAGVSLMEQVRVDVKINSQPFCSGISLGKRALLRKVLH